MWNYQSYDLRRAWLRAAGVKPKGSPEYLYWDELPQQVKAKLLEAIARQATGEKLIPALKPFDPYKFADYVLRNNVFSDADTFIYSGLSGTNPHGVPDHIWAESLASMGGEFVKTGDLYVVKTPGVERPPDMRARPTWREVTPLMSTEPELNPSTINLLATTEGDPLRKFCCRQCGECALAELLEEGKFPERIAWLRHHYKEKHPSMWGKIHPAVFPQDLAEKVREFWKKACEWEDIPLESKFVVFSDDNPYVKDYNEAVGQLLRWRQFRTGEWAPATTFKKGEGTKLDSLEIVKAYKQISRHGEDKISVSLQAWALFPRGRRPHFISMYRSGDDYIITPLYAHISEWVHTPVVKVKAWIKSLPVKHFEPMAVAPEYQEEAERLAREVDEPMAIIPLPSMARQAAVIPTQPWQMTLEEYVYGEAHRLGEAKPRIDWVKAGYGQHYRDHKASVKYALLKGKPVPPEVLKDYPDLAKIIPKAEAGMPETAVIPTQPSPPSPKQELEFVSDSPEYLAFTIDDIGYREKLDTAFETAIARAKGG